MIERKISENESNKRIDKYVRSLLPGASLSFIYKIFRQKDVKINNHWVKIDYVLKTDDVLKIYVTDEQIESFKKDSISFKKIEFNLPIIYEDENLIIINKPKGLLVHSDEKSKTRTLTQDVINYLYTKNEIDESSTFLPSPAHRIDRNTSGIVVFGKKVKVLQELSLLFSSKKDNIEKKYIALVYGQINPKNGTINKSLFKNSKTNTVYIDNGPGSKSAITEYKTIKTYKDCSLIEATLLTGRTHQIRVHMQSINHPIIGDDKYGNLEINRLFKAKYNLDFQFLHAQSITFKNIQGVLSYLSKKKFFAPLFENEQKILDDLK